MKVKIILVVLVAIVLSACDQTKSSKQVLAVKQEQKLLVKSNAAVSFKVEGMVCKMGCGGSIRKALIHSGAVERVEVDFIKEAKSQDVTVHYDSTKMDIKQLKKLIEQTNDGQFTVNAEERIKDSK